MQTLPLIFATHNLHKLQEIAPLLPPFCELHRPAEYGITRELPEDFDTIDENAQQKAEYVYAATHADCFADDTGLMVEMLNGAPGAFSARYAGSDCNYQDNIDKLLQQMEGMSHRDATFRTTIVLILRGERYFFHGEITGEILREQRGTGGFGYDPIFRPYGYQQTFAEMSLEQKDQISHRARAVQALAQFLTSYPW